MKTSEDKINEALRDVLKRKFDDYEEQPNPTALDRIRARVKPVRTGRYWWFTGALVLISVSGILLSRITRENQTIFGVPARVQAHSREVVPSTGPGISNAAKGAADAVPEIAAHASKPLATKVTVKSTELRSEQVVKGFFCGRPGYQTGSERASVAFGQRPGRHCKRV
jgi:hypothetical protein